eukprot:CAMPEP_0182543780 /NCGR_PEP_ID=MMETSP1323-20130603/32143_1 /TAXON_ID=236787 /ORGANISM="Florenciella parvula, Strain RCC1693" /LENGTH=156 /DNA_ID=CAMNT_0024754747 /DNA_START=32 /DNA_END=499 /DNA_ORIENTATION=-
MQAGGRIDPSSSPRSDSHTQPAQDHLPPTFESPLLRLRGRLFGATGPCATSETRASATPIVFEDACLIISRDFREDSLNEPLTPLKDPLNEPCWASSVLVPGSNPTPDLGGFRRSLLFLSSSSLEPGLIIGIPRPFDLGGERPAAFCLLDGPVGGG